MSIAVGVAAYDSLRSQSALIAEAVLKDLASDCPALDVDRVVGATRDDLIMHANTFAAVLATGSLPLWVHHLAWVKACMIEHGARPDDVTCVMRLLREKALRVADSDESEALWRLGLDALPDLPERVDCTERAHQPYANIASRYAQHMLNFDKHAAWDTALSVTLALPDLYIHVLGPAMYSIGNLWQANRISAAQEHYAAAATSELMAQLRINMPTSGRTGRPVFAATVAGEQHEIGIRMVADLFEYDAWVVVYLGSNVPAEEIARVAVEHDAAIIALSVTMTSRLLDVRKVSAALSRNHAQPKLLVGGLPLLLAPDLWQTLGADGTAPNAPAAVRKAAELLAA